MPAIMVSAWPFLTISQAVSRLSAGRAVILSLGSSFLRADWMIGLVNSGNTMFIGLLYTKS